MSRPSLALLAGTLVLGASAAPLAAQAARTGAIEGSVYDSLRSRPLAGALVTVMQVAPAPPLYVTAVTDVAGHFRVDSLGAGRFTVGFSTPFLDSLEIQFPARELTLVAGDHGQVDFATPSRATLVRAACPGLPLPKGRGAIVGQVVNAENDTPLRGATIVVSWNDIGVDLKAMRATSQERSGAVTADSLGLYRVCNVPTDSYVTLQVQQAGKAGTPLRAAVGDAAGVTVQNLSLSTAAAHDFATADSLPSGRDTVARLLTGTAALTGTIRTADGKPLAEAQVRVIDAAGTARSDASGHFSLEHLPAGTQLLEVRRVGYLIGQQPVDLRAGRTVTGDAILSRIVTLDSVRIVARRTNIQEFDRRRGLSSSSGMTMTGAEVEKLNPHEASDLIHHAIGFRVVGDGVDARVLSTRGPASLKMECTANVVIDGAQHQAINLIDPGNIGAIEVYRGASGAPLQYDSSCGVILIWSKR